MAQRVVPDLRLDDAEEWMGFRPSMPDSLPVIGPVPGSDRAFLAFGHGHLGLTLGAITGQIVADLVAGRDSDIDRIPVQRPTAFEPGFSSREAGASVDVHHLAGDVTRALGNQKAGGVRDLLRPAHPTE